LETFIVTQRLAGLKILIPFQVSVIFILILGLGMILKGRMGPLNLNLKALAMWLVAAF
jgi:hypothetical protein